MKNLKYLLAAALFAPLFMSCSTTESKGAATISIAGDITSASVIKGVLTPAISGVVTAPEGAVLDKVTVTAFYGENSDVLVPSAVAKIDDSKYEFFISERTTEIAGIINSLTKIQIEASVVDGDASSASVNVTFVPTALSTAQNFTWVRDGGGAATGLSDFGLAWDQNAGAASPFYAIIKKDIATKLVELDKGTWTSILTLEDLKAAVDNATDLSTGYRGIRADAGGTYDVVLGVNIGGTGVYKIIHITNATAGPGTVSGTKTTISGQYRDGTWTPAD